MKKITLEIKAEDIMSSSYMNCEDCAITRALHRAGYTNCKDTGLYIEDENYNNIIGGGNKTYDVLVERVMGMYSHKNKREYTNGKGVVKPIKPIDFTHELIY